MTALATWVGHLEGLSDAGTLYVRRPWSAGSAAVVAEEGGKAAAEALAAGFDYLLEVSIAKEVLETWSSWRGGQVPTSTEACQAILHYALHDSYLPL